MRDSSSVDLSGYLANKLRYLLSRSFSTCFKIVFACSVVEIVNSLLITFIFMRVDGAPEGISCFFTSA